MNVVIIEDEPLNAIRLKKLLNSIDPNIKVLQVLDSVKTAVSYLQASKEINLIFLDIQLTDGLGFEVITQLEQAIPIIVTTAYDQYAIEAYKYLSLDYLLKPIKEKELSRSISKYRKLYSDQRTLDIPLKAIQELFLPTKHTHTFICKRGKSRYPIKVDQIAYFFKKNCFDLFI